MKKAILTVALSMLLPLMAATTYWLFDTSTTYFSQPAQEKSLHKALFPTHDPSLLFFRTALSLIGGIGIFVIDSALLKNRKLTRDLYLSEYAVEHTNAFALIWADKEGRVIKVNKHACEKLGYSKEEMLSLTIFDLLNDAAQTAWHELLEVVKKEGNSRRLIRQKRKDGTLVDSIVYLQYLEDAGGHYQFAFIADALICPLAPESKRTPCGWDTGKLHSTPLHY